jgi:hypothetical protein
MAVNFVQQKKKQKYLLYVAVGIFIITIVILYFGFFKGKSIPSFTLPEPANMPTSEIAGKLTIDFSVLDNPLLQHLEPFVVIPPFEGEVGRINPFLPY